MQTYDHYSTSDASDWDGKQCYRTLISCVQPRPIAFVSTISSEGVANLAPFSFFNAVCAKPPTLMFCPGKKADGASKDTAVNMRAVPQCVVNVVPFGLRDAMNQSSKSYEPSVSEFEAVGLTSIASDVVKPFRVAESPVQMECKLVQMLPIGEGLHAVDLCLVEVVRFHIAEEVLDDDHRIDLGKLDLIGRLGGLEYSRTDERFSLKRPE